MDNYKLILEELRNKRRSIDAEILSVSGQLLATLFERYPQLTSIYSNRQSLGDSIMIVNKTIDIIIVCNKIIGGIEDKLPDMIKEDITEEDLYAFIRVIRFLNDEEFNLWFNKQNGYIINRDFITLMNKEIEICIEK